MYIVVRPCVFYAPPFFLPSSCFLLLPSFFFIIILLSFFLSSSFFFCSSGKSQTRGGKGDAEHVAAVGVVGAHIGVVGSLVAQDGRNVAHGQQVDGLALLLVLDQQIVNTLVALVGRKKK